MRKLVVLFFLFFFVKNVYLNAQVIWQNYEYPEVLLNHNEIGVLDGWIKLCETNSNSSIESVNSINDLFAYRIYVRFNESSDWVLIPIANSGSWRLNIDDEINLPDFFINNNIFPMRSSNWDYSGNMALSENEKNSLFWYVNDWINNNEAYSAEHLNGGDFNRLYFKITYNFVPGPNSQPTTAYVAGSMAWVKAEVLEWPLCTNREYRFTDVFMLNDNETISTNRMVAFNDESRWEINNDSTADVVLYLPNNMTSSNSPTFTVPYDVSSPNKWITYSKVINGKTYFFRMKKYVWGRANMIEALDTIPVLNTSMSPQNFDVFYDFEGDVVEYYGAGTYADGINYFMDPQISGVGSFMLNVRTKNDEDGLVCYSNWEEQTIIVQPLANPGAFPESFDFQHTFGENGGVVGYRSPIDYGGGVVEVSESDNNERNDRSWLYVSAGKYHQVCSGKEYEMKIQNAYSYVGVSYEWKMLYGGTLFDLGFGTTKIIEIPENIQLNVHQSSGLPVDFSGSNSSIGYLHLARNIPGGGKRYSLMLGDLVQVMFRRINQNGTTTIWKNAYLGAIPTPTIDANTSFCYDGLSAQGANLVATVGNSPFYADFPNSTLSMRTFNWNVNGLDNGVFQFTGNSVNIPVPDGVKVSSFGLVAVDSSYYEFYDSGNSISYEFYDLADISCKSDFELVNVVRDPEFDVDFSHTGTVVQGQPVLSVVNGNYFDVDSNLIRTQYSDGSPTYLGDSVWHYKNDLGSYDCFVYVEDQYGCSRTKEFLDYWFVPGTLSVDELNDELNLTVYPNPFNGLLHIEGVGSVDVSVYSAAGLLVRDFKSVTELDLLDVQSGVYYLQITTPSGTLVSKKVIKL